jgi:hypothetical protein
MKVKQQVDSSCWFKLLLGVSWNVSMMFHGDYKKRCLLPIMVSQILSLAQLISEIKNTFTAANGLFSTLAYLSTSSWSRCGMTCSSTTTGSRWRCSGGLASALADRAEWQSGQVSCMYSHFRRQTWQNWSVIKYWPAEWGNSVVERLTHNPKFKGSNAATARRE